MSYIFNRLGEASTWKAIISLLTGIGLFTLTNAQIDAVTGAMVSIYAALSLILPDKFGKKEG